MFITKQKTPVPNTSLQVFLLNICKQVKKKMEPQIEHTVIPKLTK